MATRKGPIRVLHYGLGPIGAAVVRQIADRRGFRIVGANVNVAIPKRNRGTAVVTFRPEKPGRYTFECSRLCGAGHSFMRGTLVVTEPEPGQ